MDKAVNLISLAGWTYLLVNIEFELIFNRDQFMEHDISTTLLILRAVQLFQIFDIILIVLGVSKGNAIASFFQILGRNVVTLFLIEPETNNLAFAGVLVLWSIADINRYLYYIFKNNSITGFLRYNGFLVLYPLGGVAEMIVINNYITRHPQLSDLYIYIIRAIQGCILAGIVVLYAHMLKSRKKYMKTLKEEAAKQEKPEQVRTRKEQSKRD